MDLQQTNKGMMGLTATLQKRKLLRSNKKFSNIIKKPGSYRKNISGMFLTFQKVTLSQSSKILSLEINLRHIRRKGSLAATLQDGYNLNLKNQGQLHNRKRFWNTMRNMGKSPKNTSSMSWTFQMVTLSQSWKSFSGK